MKTAKLKKTNAGKTVTKKTLLTLIKTNKTLSMWIGLFIAIVSLIGIIQKWRTKDVTGKWLITFKNESSSYIPYIGETHTQEVLFIQNEKSLSGDGEKTEYNGKPLAANQHRKLEYKGSVDGKKIIASFILHGERRVSQGDISVTVSNDGETMEGTFSGTAGNCKGSVTGKKITN